MTRLWGVVAVLCLAGCVEADLVACGDLACPSGTVCTPGGCALAEDAAACAGSDDGSPCTTNAIGNGACGGGACHAIVCGDAIRDPGEVCDDANASSGDGCSADCRSAEMCGNQIVDGIAGEQCDEGIPGLSGDGCSSRCSDEVDLWLDVGTGAGPTMATPTAATGPGGHVFTFGGIGSSGQFLDDTWEWDGTTWQLHASYVSPPPSRFVSMVYDTRRERLVLFGGRDSTNLALGDTWEWDGVTWIRRTPAVSPTPRWSAAISYDAVRERVVLFGGSTGSSELADTWVWDGVTWVEAHPLVSPLPDVRAMTFDTKRERSVLVSSTSIVPTWEWDGTTWTAHAAPPVTGALLSYDASRTVSVLLGSDATTWEWNGAVWNQRAVGASPITAQGIHGAAYDTARSTLVVVGQPTSVLTSEVSELTTGWNVVTPLIGPAATAPRTYDARRGKTVAADGFTGTWEWNGRSWRRVVSAAATPSLTRFPKMAYDERRGLAVLFGPNATFVPSTWLWDGSTWVDSGAAGPPNRISPEVAYDASRGVIVMFGGRGFGDTWEWDGTTWTEKTPATGPGDRERHAMAYDRKRQRVVMFGGLNRNVAAFGDTWEWDGAAWTELHPTMSPSPRLSHGMAYDPQRGRIVVVGKAGDAWEFDGTTWTERVLLIPTPSDGSVAQDISGGLVLGAQPLRLAHVSETGEREGCIAAVDTDRDGLAGCADPDCWTRCMPLCSPGTTCTATDPRCGDAVCAGVEDYLICPQDCAQP